MEKKYNKINILKQKLDILIETVEINIKYSLNKINTLSKKYINCLNFCKYTNIYEYDKISEIKKQYLKLKKIITVTNNLNKQINKIYSNIINYYINIKLNFIKDNIDLMNFNFIFLKKYNSKLISTKYNIIIKNTSIVKEQLDIIYIKYNQIKEINKMLIQLKKLK